jgi:hypothetical protein
LLDACPMPGARPGAAAQSVRWSIADCDNGKDLRGFDGSGHGRVSLGNDQRTARTLIGGAVAAGVMLSWCSSRPASYCRQALVCSAWCAAGG